ncbi:phage portal protein [Parvularcula sp. LCG005]|uniref:phage portal protein n=1 Tax=Parvularcula sp. LCG005 TaxID=3078805 RepID=UPI0029423889|nr:phage portal protein [Parvularcula sp. LCG005]WOI53990.1 phage portal protein [Parvularcula sp. LCG005]
MFGLTTRKGDSSRAPEAKGTVLSDLIALHGMGQPSWTGRDSASLTTNGFGRNVIAYRCVQMIADAASAVPLILCQAGERQYDHPLCRLLRSPNPDQTGQALLEEVYGHLQIHGNAYLEIIDGDQGAAALYCLRPDRVQVQTGRDGWPSAYTYGAGTHKRVISRRPDGSMPLIHLRLFNPGDDRYGQAPMQVAGNAIDLHNTAMAWNKSLLDNAARPSGALVYRGEAGAGHLTGDQFDRLKAELSETFQGARHAGRPMLLDGGLDWKPMSLSPAEMDFIDLKNSASRDIALAFGVPPMLLGIPGDNTYSNYQQAVLAFWRHTILPLIGKVVAGLNHGLGLSDVEIGFDEERIDALADGRLARLDLLLSSDVLTSEEKRLALGYPALPEGGTQ